MCSRLSCPTTSAVGFRYSIPIPIPEVKLGQQVVYEYQREEQDDESAEGGAQRALNYPFGVCERPP